MCLLSWVISWFSQKKNVVRESRVVCCVGKLNWKTLYLFLGRRLQGGCSSLVPPGQRGAEPLHLAQVDEKGAVRAVHAIKCIARVRGPTSTHPLEGKDSICCVRYILTKLFKYQQTQQKCVFHGHPLCPLIISARGDFLTTSASV